MDIRLDRLYRLNRRLIIWGVFFGLLYLLRDFFAVIFLTFFIAFFAYPPIRWGIERLGMNRVLAVTLVHVMIAAAYVTLAIWITPALVVEAGALQENLPELKQTAKRIRAERAEQYPQIAGLMDAYLDEATLDRMMNDAERKLNAYLPRVAGQALILGSMLLIAILLSYLTLIDLAGLREGLGRVKFSRLRDFFDQTAQPVVRFAYVVGRAMQAQALIALANTGLTFIGLSLLGLPSLAMLSLIVFVCSFVPAFGVFISTTPMVLVALNAHGVGRGVAVIGFVVIVHAIEAYVLNPLIYGKHLKLNPVLVLMILFVGHHAFGIWGMLLGVPITIYLLHDVFGVPVLGDRVAAPPPGRMKVPSAPPPPTLPMAGA